jgi:hypothetical protein
MIEDKVNVKVKHVPRLPKHRNIYEQIRNEIVAGQFGEGHRLPSEAELVARFQVSRPTVGRALRDLQLEGLITRRSGAGSFIRSSPTLGMFGLIIPALGNTEIFEPMCAEMARAAQSHKFNLLWGDSSGDQQQGRNQAERLCQQYIDRKVSGVFFAPLELTVDKEAVNRRIAKNLSAAGIPLVLLDRDVAEFPERSSFDLVGSIILPVAIAWLNTPSNWDADGYSLSPNPIRRKRWIYAYPVAARRWCVSILPRRRNGCGWVIHQRRSLFANFLRFQRRTCLFAPMI